MENYTGTIFESVPVGSNFYTCRDTIYYFLRTWIGWMLEYSLGASALVTLYRYLRDYFMFTSRQLDRYATLVHVFILT